MKAWHAWAAAGAAVFFAAVFFLAGWLSESVDWPWFNDQRAIETVAALGQLLLVGLLVVEIRETRLERRAVDQRQRDARAQETEDLVASFVASASNAIAVYQGTTPRVRQAITDRRTDDVLALLDQCEPYRQAAYGLLLRIRIHFEAGPLVEACEALATEMNARREVLMDARGWIERFNAGDHVPSEPQVRERLRRPAGIAVERCVTEARAARAAVARGA